MLKRPTLLIAALAIAAATTASSATDYRFRVSCPDGAHVVSWETGTIDPGREYLRVITGTRNEGCSIGDYDAGRDARLPVDHESHAGAVIDGLPPVSIIRGILGF